MDIYVGGGSGTYAGEPWGPDEIAKKIVGDLKLRDGDTISKNQIIEYLEKFGWAPTWASDIAIVLRNMFGITPVFYESYSGSALLDEMKAVFSGEDTKPVIFNENDYRGLFTSAVTESFDNSENEEEEAIIAALSLESLDDVLSLAALSENFTEEQLNTLANIFLAGGQELMEAWYAAYTRPHMIRFMDSKVVNDLSEVIGCSVLNLSEAMAPAPSGLAPAKRRMFKQMAKGSAQNADPMASGQSAINRLHNMRLNAVNKAVGKTDGSFGAADTAARNAVRGISNKIKGQAGQFKSSGNRAPLPPDFHGGHDEVHGPAERNKEQFNNPVRHSRIQRGLSTLGRVLGNLHNASSKAKAAIHNGAQNVGKGLGNAKQAYQTARAAHVPVQHDINATPNPSNKSGRSAGGEVVRGVGRGIHGFGSEVLRGAGRGLHGFGKEVVGGFGKNKSLLGGIAKGTARLGYGLGSGAVKGAGRLAYGVGSGIVRGAGHLVKGMASKALNHILPPNANRDNHKAANDMNNNPRLKHAMIAHDRVTDPAGAYLRHGEPSEDELRAAQHMGLHNAYKKNLGIELPGYEKSLHGKEAKEPIVPREQHQADSSPTTPEATPRLRPNPKRRMGVEAPRRRGAL